MNLLNRVFSNSKVIYNFKTNLVLAFFVHFLLFLILDNLWCKAHLEYKAVPIPMSIYNK